MDAARLLTSRRLPGPQYRSGEACVFLVVVVFFFLSGCTEKTAEPLPGPDTSDLVPPRPVTDLQLDSRTAEWISLSWTAPGDDGDVGQAFRYDVRRSQESITEESWGSASQITGEPWPPFASGRTQVFTMSETNVQTTYYFALRTLDDNGNYSDLSNVVEAPDLVTVDDVAPGRVVDLRASDVGTNSVELTWTATGDDVDLGTADGYVFRFSRLPLNSENFDGGDLLAESPIPVEAGSVQVWVVDQLTPGTTYYFGLRAWDEASNEGPVSNILKVTTEVG